MENFPPDASERPDAHERLKPLKGFEPLVFLGIAAEPF